MCISFDDEISMGFSESCTTYFYAVKWISVV